MGARFSTRSDAPTEVPALFIPGVEGRAPVVEAEYVRLRDAVRADTQREPRQKRIFSMQCRLEGQNCIVEVGQADPVNGDEVIAIFDVGGDDRYSVYTDGDGDGPAMQLHKRTIYSVTEFS